MLPLDPNVATILTPRAAFGDVSFVPGSSGIWRLADSTGEKSRAYPFSSDCRGRIGALQIGPHTPTEHRMFAELSLSEMSGAALSALFGLCSLEARLCIQQLRAE